MHATETIMLVYIFHGTNPHKGFKPQKVLLFAHEYREYHVNEIHRGPRVDHYKIMLDFDHVTSEMTVFRCNRRIQLCSSLC